MRFAKEAWPFVFPPAALGALAIAFAQPVAGSALLVIAFGVLLFFRDPDRRFEGDGAIVLAAADGRIIDLAEVEDAEVGAGRFHRIATFLSVFDVHTQRSPATGAVVASTLRRGAKVAAFVPDAGAKNEAHTNVLRLDSGDIVAVRQLAGLVARRVVSYLRVGDRPRRGEPMGVIKFGSRVDLFVPASYRVLVAKGDRVRSGETPMAQPGPKS